MHGYHLARALQRRSHGSFHCKEGLIYPRLHRMEHEGLVRSEWAGERGRRKVCVPTAEGEGRLADELQHWQAVLLSMEQLLGLTR